jgi:hypothetical protein
MFLGRAVMLCPPTVSRFVPIAAIALPTLPQPLVCRRMDIDWPMSNDIRSSPTTSGPV